MDTISATETSQSKKRPIERSTDESANAKVTKKDEKPTPAYGSQEYWENRYKNSMNEDFNKCEDDPDPYHAWYFVFEDLAPILLPLILGSDGNDDVVDEGDDDEERDADTLPKKGTLPDISENSKSCEEDQTKPPLQQNNNEIDSFDDGEQKRTYNSSESTDTGTDLDERDHSDGETETQELEMTGFEEDAESESGTIRPGLAKNGPISVVEIGCGDAPLGRDLALSIQEYGTKNNRDPSTIVQKVVCLDYSRNVIDMMKREQKKEESHIEEKDVSLCYEVADARRLAYQDESFDLILEKGTLDAMLSDSDGNGQSNCRKIVAECARVLKVGGYIVIISHLNAHVESGIEWLNSVIVPGLKDSGSFEWLIEVHGSDVEIPSDVEDETDKSNQRQIQSPGPAVYFVEKVKAVAQGKAVGDIEQQQPTIPLKFFSY